MTAPTPEAALTEQLQQAQAACDRWALNYNMAQADLARARGSYEVDVLRLTGERNDLKEQLAGALETIRNFAVDAGAREDV